MDADTDKHGEERIALPGMDIHIMEMVVIECLVVYSFAGSTIFI